MQQRKILQLDPRDNVLIALSDLRQGETVEHNGDGFTLISRVPAKHKFATEDLPAGAGVTMYGVLVGCTSQPVRRGELLTTGNVHHQSDAYREKQH
jgi:altronate hydrolase